VAAAALVAWWVIERGFGRRALGRAVAIGIVSHLVLDIATHAPDIALWPGSPFGRLGLGLYSGAPSVAFVVELVYGVLCWWIYRGSRALLWVVVAGNLADLSFFFAGIPGPEQFLAGHPMLIVTVIFGQIIAMLVLVGLFASKQSALRNVPGPGEAKLQLKEPLSHSKGLADPTPSLRSNPVRAGYPARIIHDKRVWPSPPVPASASTRSPRRSVPAAWARFIARAIRGSGVTLRSRYCPALSLPTSIASIDSSRKPARPRR
jgi:membrane-bound metal-dependent hydrolase YbcI (DUF457 family)